MKEILRNGLTAVALTAGTTFGLKAVENNVVQAAGVNPEVTSQRIVPDFQLTPSNNELNNFQKTGVTFLVSAEILGVALLGRRLADGTMSKTEKYGWLIGVPSANFVGAAILLSEVWR